MVTESDPGKLRRRGIYLAMRIKALKDEVARLREEENELAASLSSRDDKKSPESKRLKSRLIYVRSRPHDARNEIKLAAEEKTRIAAVLGRSHAAD